MIQTARTPGKMVSGNFDKVKVDLFTNAKRYGHHL